MTKINRHFLLPNVVICFTLYTREIATNHLSYFVACKCVIYFRVPYLGGMVGQSENAQYGFFSMSLATEFNNCKKNCASLVGTVFFQEVDNFIVMPCFCKG